MSKRQPDISKMKSILDKPLISLENGIKEIHLSLKIRIIYKMQIVNYSRLK